jgi:hypothetical protein
MDNFWNFSCSSYGGIPLKICDLTATASYNSEERGLESQASLILLHHKTVESAVGSLRAGIAQVNIVGKCKFMVNSQSLNWTSKGLFQGGAFFWKFGLEEARYSGELIHKISRLPNSESYGCKTVSCRHRPISALLRFYQIT